MIHFQCPHCNQRLKVDAKQAGQFIRCPYCRTKFIPGESGDPSEQFFNSTEPTEEPEPLVLPEAPPEVPAEAPSETPPEAPSRTPSPRVVSHSDAREERLSKPGQEINHEELIDMTAMVDIVFFLLIFFLVTSMSAILSSAPLPRPEAHNDDGAAKAARPDNAQNNSDAVVVKINKDDVVEIDGVPFRDIADVAIRFRQLRDSGGADTSILVVGHGEASHGTAAAVLDAGYEAGINHLRLAVLDDESE